MNPRSIFILWVFYTLNSCFSVALGQYGNFDHITSSEGLSNNSINAVFQDSRDFIWIATDDGLNRFDGYEFVLFRHDIFDSVTIPSNRIHSIDEDSKGNLWLGTSKGLSKYDPSTGLFTNYTFFDSPYDRDVNEIMKVEIDGRGQIWLLHRDNLIRFFPEDEEFVKYPLSGYGSEYILPHRTALEYHEMSGLLFIGTETGVVVFRPETEEFTWRGMHEAYVHDFCTVGSGELWIGTSEGLWHCTIDPDSSVLVEIDVIFPGKSIYGIDPLGNGMLRLLDSRKMVFYDFIAGQTLEMEEFAVKNFKGFPGARLVFRDRSETLWIGTHNGLFHLDLKPRKFHYLCTNNPMGLSLHSDIISSIYAEGEYLLLGSWGGGLEVIHRPSLTSRYFTRSAAPSGYPETGVNMISRIEDGKFWVGGNALYRFDLSTSRFIKAADLFRGYSGDRLMNARISDIVNLPGNRMVVAHWKGITHIDHEQQTIRNDTVLKLDSIDLKITMATSLATDSSDVWIGFEAGLLHYSVDEDWYVFYPSDNGNGLSGHVLTLKLDSRGRLWVGTPVGLFRYYPETGKFAGYTTSQGLTNDFIYSIEEDHNGRLWVSTNKGISSFHPESGEVLNYGVINGLSSMEFNLQASYAASSGVIYFGSIRGVNFFHPDSVQNMSDPPRIAITGYTVFNRSQGLETPDIKGGIRIRDDESIQVSFAVLDFANPLASEYRYRLLENGGSGEWIPIGRDNSVILSGLKHGHYRFEVTGRNSEGVLSRNIAAARVDVTAPFHRRKVFLVFMFLPILLLLFFIFEYRTKTLRKSNRALREKEIAAKEVLRQKNLLSKRNKNIEDSLKYAQRIQYAMFTNAREIAEMFPSSFILQKPKDIVSGDFYWAKRVDNHVFLAAVDCTGHGVPGAFMSLIGLEFFRQIITVKKIFKPAEILDQINYSFDELFGGVQDISLKDGMDVSLCAFDLEKKSLEFAGAFNPLYIIRDGELIEIKGDKTNIGPNMGFQRLSFTNHDIELKKNDMIYLFSDGYADQFGGPEGKKFKYRRFRHLLLSVYDKPVEVQHQVLEQSINEWKGNLEQVDDMLVIGVKASRINGSFRL